MKILFVNVSKNWQGRVYSEYPIGIGILATMASKDGHEIKILDMAVDDTPLRKVVEEFQPEVTALSFLSTSATTATQVIEELNGLSCGYLLSGGIHTSIFPIEMVNLGVDVSLIGEGEINFMPLIKHLEIYNDSPFSVESLKEIPNLVFKDKKGEVQRTFNTKKSVDLTASDCIDRDLFNLELYPHHTIMTSRGCPYKCKFCCSWGPGGRKGRMATPERILSELEMLVNKYGQITVYWADDMFFFNKRDRLRFCNMMIERQLPVKWIAQLRPDSLDDELATALVKAGCEKICIGAESGSDRILDAINKKTQVSDIEQCIKIAKNVGIRIKTWWITGLPGSTLEDEYSALKLIERSMPNEVAIHTFVPLPGTEYWDNSEQYGIHLPSMDELEKLYYYGEPGGIKLDYITKEEMTNVLLAYNKKLRELGYLPTDKAQPDSPYVYTSPLQDRTFSI